MQPLVDDEVVDAQREEEQGGLPDKDSRQRKVQSGLSDGYPIPDGDGYQGDGNGSEKRDELT